MSDQTPYEPTPGYDEYGVSTRDRSGVSRDGEWFHTGHLRPDPAKIEQERVTHRQLPPWERPAYVAAALATVQARLLSHDAAEDNTPESELLGTVLHALLAIERRNNAAD